MGWSEWKRVQAKTREFPREAFEFVKDGLEHTARMVHGEAGAGGEPDARHVNGQQLCMGLKDYAIKRYGLLARTVLERWSIRSTEDFGRIVFAMIDAKLMRKHDDDSLEDFRDVFDFDEAFTSPQVH